MMRFFEGVGLYQFRESRERSRKVEEVSPQIYTSIHLCAAQPSSNLFHSTHIFRIIKRKEKKPIIFLYISIIFFLCYTTIIQMMNEIFSIQNNLGKCSCEYQRNTTKKRYI